MTQECAVCGRGFEARRSTARYCGGSCRARASMAPKAAPSLQVERLRAVVSEMVGLPSSGGTGIEAETLAQLESVGRVGTPAGQMALFMAHRIESGLVETGASVAALGKAHREALTDAMRDSSVEADPLDAIRQSAALKLIRSSA